MNEGGEGQPGHECGVLHRVPEPVAAPSEDGVGPPRTQQQSRCQQRPGDDAPDAPGVHPLVAGLARQQPAEGEGEGYADAHQPGHKRGRVEEHPEMGEQRVDALAVLWHKGQFVKGVGHEGHDRQEESQHQHQHAGGVGQGIPHTLRRAPHRHRRHHRQHHGDVQQRTLVAGVEGDPGETVGHCQITVAGDVGNLEVPRYKGDHQRKRGDEQHNYGGVHGGLRALHQRGRAAQLSRHRPHAGVSGQGQRHPQADCAEVTHRFPLRHRHSRAGGNPGEWGVLLH